MLLIKYAISNIRVFAIWKYILKYFHLYYLQYYWKNELSHFKSKIQPKNEVLSITGM